MSRRIFLQVFLPFNFDALFFGQSLIFRARFGKSHLFRLIPRERNPDETGTDPREKKLGREKKGIEIKWEDPDQNQEKEGNLKKKRNLKRIKSELIKIIY